MSFERKLLAVTMVFLSLFLMSGKIEILSSAHSKTFNILDFGAIGDGQTLNTVPIQKAIDACHGQGGGMVIVPAGNFVTGTILLKDNVTLYLDQKATLLGSLNPGDYRNVDPFKDGLGAEVGFAMVAAVDAKNVGIAGNGVINGRGKEIAAAMPFKGEGWGGRPFLVRFVRSNHVKVSDVKLFYAAAWTANFFQCNYLTIERLKITSYGVPHNDGINIDSSQNISIKDCDVESGDDALVFKTTSSRPVRNVTVTNCRLKTNQGAIKLGTESVANFENIMIRHIQIRDTQNGGIKILSADGGQIKNVIISDITMDNVATPVFVRLGARLKSFREGEPKKSQPGLIKNVVIRNIKAKASAKAQIMPPTGIFLTGIPGYQIGDLTLENIEIELAGGGEREHGRQKLEENIDGYPEINRFGPRLPAFGLFARHVNGLKIKGLIIKLEMSDLRPAVVCEDCRNLEFTDWKIPASFGAESLVRFESTQTARLKGFELDGTTDTFILVEGKESRDIQQKNNKLGIVKKVIQFGKEVSAATVPVKKT
jgi:hypothetical protein